MVEVAEIDREPPADLDKLKFFENYTIISFLQTDRRDDFHHGNSMKTLFKRLSDYRLWPIWWRFEMQGTTQSLSKDSIVWSVTNA